MPVKNEFRAVWVATIRNMDFERTSDEKAFRAAFLKVTNLCVEWNLNAVIFHVRPLLDAWYKSSINPWSQFITDKNRQGFDPGYDPLAIMTEECHKRGLEFHAWFNPYRVTNTSYAGETPDLNAKVLTTGKTTAEIDTMPNKEAVKLLLKAYVEDGTLTSDNWAVLNPDKTYRFVGDNYRKIYLDAGHPDVIKHVAESAAEVAANYDVDAIHFDDYFYPYGATYEKMRDVDQPTFDAFAEGYGSTRADREQWWRDNNTKLIRAVARAVKDVNAAKGKSVQFGISPFGIWSNDPSIGGSNTPGTGQSYTDGVYSDSRGWVEEELIDYIVPQLYWQMDHKLAPYSVMAPWWNNLHEGKKVRLYVGLGNYRYTDPPSAKDPSWDRPEEILEELLFNEKNNLTNIKGFVFFRYGVIAVNDLLASGREGILAKSNALLKEYLTGSKEAQS